MGGIEQRDILVDNSLDEKRGPAFRGRMQLRLTFTSQNAQLYEIRCWELADLCCNEIGVVGMRLPLADPGIALKNPVNRPIKMGKWSFVVCSWGAEGAPSKEGKKRFDR